MIDFDWLEVLHVFGYFLSAYFFYDLAYTRGEIHQIKISTESLEEIYQRHDKIQKYYQERVEFLTKLYLAYKKMVCDNSYKEEKKDD